MRSLLAQGASALFSNRVQIVVNRSPVGLSSTKDAKILTALRVASMKGHLGCVKALIELVPSVISHDETCEGPTALVLALHAYQTDLVKLLVSNGAKTEGPFSEEGATLLHEIFCGPFAVSALNKKGCPMPPLPLLSFLVHECKIDVNSPNGSGSTPLHIIANFGSVQAAKLLVERFQANPHITDGNGDTPLASARALKKIMGAQFMGRTPIDFDPLITYLALLK